MNYREKYIKYKTKYITLKNNQYGGNEKTAKKSLEAFITKSEPSNIANIDTIFKSIISIFDDCDDKVKNDKIKLYADLLVGLYKNNPVEYNLNKEKIKTLLDKHYILRINGIKINLVNITNITDVINIELVINEKYEKIKSEQLSKESIIIHLDTKNLTIYEVKTLEASEYYGRNTKWCTRKIKDGENKFKEYSDIGPLYIIIPKYPEKSKSEDGKYESYLEKYQFHFETASFMDQMDDPIDPYILIEERFKDDKFRKWFKEKLTVFCDMYKDSVYKDSEFMQDNEIMQLLIMKYLPENLESISLLNAFNEPLSENFKTMTNLISLKLGNFFNSSLNNLPKNLKYIDIGNSFNSSLNNLPKNLEYINIGNSFNKPLSENFKTMTKLTSLILGDSFNSSLNNLPENLVYIKLGDSFNEQLPENFKTMTKLTSLILGYSFNSSLNNLPKNLEYINIGNSFNKPLPENFKTKTKLTSLILGDSFNSSLNNLPENLVYIELAHSFNEQLPENFKTMTKLTNLKLGDSFNSSLNNLPKNLEYIDIGNSFNEQLPENFKTMTKLTNLKLGDSFNSSLNNLPENLEYIDIGNSFNEPLPENFKTMTKLERLELGDKFNNPLDYLPENLHYITIGNSFNYPFNYPLPENFKNMTKLKYLNLGGILRFL